MPRYDTFPDAEAVASAKIRAFGIAALGTPSRVYSSIPSAPTYPLCVVQRLGGVPVERHHIDVARIQVDTWGTTKSEARDVAEAARRALHELEGTSTANPTSYVSAVDDTSGLTWLPDPTTARDRYLFSVNLYFTAGL